MSHLRNLIAVAFADGKIEDSELASIAIVMSREGMTENDLERCMKHPKGITFTQPSTDEERLRYLTDMVLVMMSDGDIDHNEMMLCKATAIALGYRHEIIDALILKIITDLKNVMNH